MAKLALLVPGPRRAELAMPPSAEKCCSRRRRLSWRRRQNAMLWPPRVAVVTGANRGLGLALAESLAESGTHVVLAARDEQLCTAAATALATAKGVSVEAVHLDVQCGRSIETFGAYCEQTFGGVDLLVNNAAVCEAGWSEEVVRRALRTNVLGPRALTQRLLPALRQRPHSQVLHVSSGDGELLYLSPELQQQMAAVRSERTLLRLLAAARPPRNSFGDAPAYGASPAYAVSKAALNALTRVQAAAVPGVWVGAACPGDVLSRMALCGKRGGP